MENLDISKAEHAIVHCTTSDGKPGFGPKHTNICYGYKPGDEESMKQAHEKSYKAMQAVLFNQHKIGSLSNTKDPVKARYMEDMESFVQGEDNEDNND